MKNFCVKVKSNDRRNDISATMTTQGTIELYVKHHEESVLAAEINFWQTSDGSLNVEINPPDGNLLEVNYQPKKEGKR